MNRIHALILTLRRIWIELALFLIITLTLTIYYMNKHTTIEINISEQQLYLYDTDHRLIYQCTVSTGMGGEGNEENSAQTPLGAFATAERFGEGCDPHTIFIARKPVGTYPHDIPAHMDENSDFILTRIIWLKGLNEENANTQSRYIYIHGTNQSDLLGEKRSHGCIRVSPDSMIEIFKNTNNNTLINIQK